jgi:hypothetical protein
MIREEKFTSASEGQCRIIIKDGSGEDGAPRPLLRLYEAPPSSFEKVERLMMLVHSHRVTRVATVADPISLLFFFLTAKRGQEETGDPRTRTSPQARASPGLSHIQCCDTISILLLQ